MHGRARLTQQGGDAVETIDGEVKVAVEPSSFQPPMTWPVASATVPLRPEALAGV